MQDLLYKLFLTKKGNHFVFQSPKTGKPYSDLKKGWYSLIKRVGLEGTRFHDLRHCWATYALLRGGDLISIQNTLGHESVSTTQRYAKALLEGQRRLVNSFQVAESDSNIIDLKEAVG